MVAQYHTKVQDSLIAQRKSLQSENAFFVKESFNTSPRAMCARHEKLVSPKITLTELKTKLYTKLSWLFLNNLIQYLMTNYKEEQPCRLRVM